MLSKAIYSPNTLDQIKSASIKSNVTIGKTRPLLKWAGGKTQLLEVLTKFIPDKYGRYIEPFFGGGALYFDHQPRESIIADSNPELINLYNVIASNPKEVIKLLKEYLNDSEFFYQMRAKDRLLLSCEEAAARTIYLNRTCFNGLYRVNRKNEFNVPFGRYKNPLICDVSNILNVSKLLKSTEIVCGDYKDVLKKHAKPNDFIFLDPPYLPISEYSDFKRYTKEQFYEEDHRDLADEVHRLYDMGCNIVLTNSNNPLVHELYGKYKIEIHQTRRNINSNGSKRTGEDVIVIAKHEARKYFNINSTAIISGQATKYPSTRYMGSKTKILPYIRDIVRKFECDTVLDLFSGSGVVSYMLKAEGKEVWTNDYMALGSTLTKAMIENNEITLNLDKAKKLMNTNAQSDNFVQRTFEGLYFTNEENILIDNIRCNIKQLKNPYEKAIAKSAIIRACFKKRPRGIFTYVGERYDDGRKDIRTALSEHFLNAVAEINQAVFDNGAKSKSFRLDAMNFKKKPDLVYMDPPYYSPLSDNEYVRRYHFVEGIACDWQDVEIQWHTKTKKIKNYPTPFSSRLGAHDAFDKLFSHFKESILVVSYSSNSQPTLDEMVSLISKYKQNIEIITIDHTYSIGNQGSKIDANKNKVQEYLFIGY